MISNSGAYELLRVLPFERAEGAYQLAVSEAVIVGVGRGFAPATFRAYSWAGDALVLGAGQSTAGIDLEACRARGCQILRRISGGTGVVHDGYTVSFQLVLPAGHACLSDDIHVNYRLISSIVIDMLAEFGVHGRAATIAEAREDRPPSGLEPICFSSLAPFEVIANERKLVGLGQVRRRNASALQGMLYLRIDPMKSVVLLLPGEETPSRLARVLAGRTTDLESLTGEMTTAMEVATALCRVAATRLGTAVSEEFLTEEERELASGLQRSKYANPEWIFRR